MRGLKNSEETRASTMEMVSTMSRFRMRLISCFNVTVCIGNYPCHRPRHSPTSTTSISMLLIFLNSISSPLQMRSGLAQL